MIKSKQEWDKQITEIIMEPITPSNALSFSDRNKNVLEIVDNLLKTERQRVVEMIKASRKTILGYDPLPGSEYDKINVVLDKLISDLQSKLTDKETI